MALAVTAEGHHVAPQVQEVVLPVLQAVDLLHHVQQVLILLLAEEVVQVESLSEVATVHSVAHRAVQQAVIAVALAVEGRAEENASMRHAL